MHELIQVGRTLTAPPPTQPSGPTILDAGPVIVYAVVDDALSPNFPLGVELEVFIRREDAERFIEEVHGDDPELSSNLRIEERELEARRNFIAPQVLRPRPRTIDADLGFL